MSPRWCLCVTSSSKRACARTIQFVIVLFCRVYSHGDFGVQMLATVRHGQWLATGYFDAPSAKMDAKVCLFEPR